MPITIGVNTNALKISGNLNENSRVLSSAYGKLSSGVRIAKASDDAAGLALADSLRLNTRLMQVAIRNTNDGISALSVADGALEQIQQVLQRQSELANQASNGFFTAAQRSVLATEFDALGSEVERVATGTAFNGITLLSGNNNITLQIGIDTTALSQMTMPNVGALMQNLGLAASGGSAPLYSLTGTSTAFSQSAARAALTALGTALDNISKNRGALGALEERLNTQLSNLAVARENTIAAEGRIRDLDVAEEAANLTRASILQQAGASVLAQANQSPRIALALLQ